MQGIFDLKTPKDLLAKLQADFKRLTNDPLDSYAAFDFFVTARHLPDWLYPSDEKRRQELFACYVELRIARHIADGGKHFEATHSQHRQVTNTSRETGMFQFGAFQSNAFDVGKLVVVLDSRDPDTIALGSVIEVTKLAKRLLEICEQQVGP